MFTGALLLAATIAFPIPGQLPPLEQCYVIGAAPRGVTNVVVNGKDVAVYRTGAWSTVTPLTEGTNVIAVTGGDWTTNVTVVVAPKPPPPPPEDATNKPPEKVWTKLDYTKDEARPHPEGKAPGEITIVLDPGHGGPQDLGARSPHGFPEKDANLHLALAVRRALERRGFRVLMTREDDRAVELTERPRLAVTNDADAFVSIHHNAPGYAKDPTDLRYHAVYCWNPLGERLAKAINAQMTSALDGDIPTKGVLHANFAVTRNPETPSCLIETDFVTSPAGEEAIWNNDRRVFIAEAIADGIDDWRKQKGTPDAP